MDDHLETSRYAIKTLEKALRIYTPSLSEKALADFLADRVLANCASVQTQMESCH